MQINRRYAPDGENNQRSEDQLMSDLHGLHVTIFTLLQIICQLLKWISFNCVNKSKCLIQYIDKQFLCRLCLNMVSIS